MMELFFLKEKFGYGIPYTKGNGVNKMGRRNKITVPGAIVTCATDAGFYPVNEDFCGWKDLPAGRVLVVADGVSGSPEGATASKVTVEVFLQEVEQASTKSNDRIDRGVIQAAYEKACAAISARTQQTGLSTSPETTFISVVELEDRFLFSYVGDGAIVLTTGSLKYATNLLIPHIGYAGALTRTLNAQVEQPKPAYIEVEKGFEDGEIVLIGTDGALPPGRVLESSKKALEELRRTCQDEGECFDESSARQVLEEMVKNVLPFDDNRTLGLILTKEAVSYWLQCRKNDKSSGLPP
jgi:hypothetical protein